MAFDYNSPAELFIPKRKGGGRVADVKELVAKLRNEAKVIP